MIEKVIHKSTLKKLRKEVNLEIKNWTKASKSGHKYCENDKMPAVNRAVMLLALLGLPRHIGDMKRRRNRISLMIKRKSR